MQQNLIDSAEAARLLGVSRATLYAYVSRGLIKASPHPEDPRRQLYDAREIAALVRRKRQGRKPREAAARALDRGLPVLVSAISRIDGRRLFYRDQDAQALSRTLTLEGVARILWNCGDADPFTQPHRPPMLTPELLELPIIPRCQAVLVSQFFQEPTLWRRDPRSLWPSAAAIVRTLASAGAGSILGDGPLHSALARHWNNAESADPIRRALVLSADHELNASTFTARVVASAGASLTSAVVAGLSALGGPRHGGQILMVEELFVQASQSDDLHGFIDAKLRRGEILPGVGHPLYLDGDCRATELLDWLPHDRLVDELAETIRRLTGHHPNIDFALVAMRRSLNLPPDAASFLFMVGRSVGWIAHALEQQGEDHVIRPRAGSISGVPQP